MRTVIRSRVESDCQLEVVTGSKSRTQKKGKTMGRGLITLLIAVPLIGSCTEVVEVKTSPPEACNLISDTVLHIGEILRKEVCFEDDDVASLTYDVRSSDPGIISVTLEEPSVLIMWAVRVGDARITVIATNTAGLSASVIFTARVPNRDPGSVC